MYMTSFSFDRPLGNVATIHKINSKSIVIKSTEVLTLSALCKSAVKHIAIVIAFHFQKFIFFTISATTQNIKHREHIHE